MKQKLQTNPMDRTIWNLAYFNVVFLIFWWQQSDFRPFSIGWPSWRRRTGRGGSRWISWRSPWHWRCRTGPSSASEWLSSSGKFLSQIRLVDNLIFWKTHFISSQISSYLSHEHLLHLQEHARHPPAAIQVWLRLIENRAHKKGMIWIANPKTFL